MSKSSRLACYVEAVVEDFVTEEDPEFKVWKDTGDLAPMEHDLTEVIEGCVADWLIEQREKLNE